MASTQTVCKTKNKAFCYNCAEYVIVKRRKPFSKRFQEKYKKTWGLDGVKHLNQPWVPSTICIACAVSYKRVQRPAKWHKPNKTHSDCFICKTDLGSQKSKANKFKYSDSLSCSLPIRNGQTVPQSNQNAESSEDEAMESAEEE